MLHILPASQTILSSCLRLVVASTSGAVLERRKAEANGTDYSGHHPLRVVTTEQGAKFVNVDLTTEHGVKQAAELDLIGSGLADVILAPNLNLVTDNLLSSKLGRAAKAFAVFRHPIERAVSIFHYLAIADWEPTYDPSLANMTIEEWTVSGRSPNNMMTRTLCGMTKGDRLSEDHLEFAKNLIQRKFVVGLTTEMKLSWKRFRYYFGWTNSTYKHSETCLARLVKSGANSNRHSKVEKGSKEWEALAVINKW